MGHRLGTFLLVIGVGVLAWAATVYFWKDPFTTAYTAYEQRRLESTLDEQFESWQPLRTPVGREPRQAEAASARRRAARGEAVPPRERRRGRDREAEGPAARVERGRRQRNERLRPPPRAGTTPRVVHARRARARLHRRAPDDVRRAVRRHRRASPRRHDHRSSSRTRRSCIASRDIGSSTTTTSSVLESHHHEQLVLQACHPRFFASQRYLVYARPVSVTRRELDSSVPGGWESVRLEDIEPISVVDGTLLWRPVRRTLDIGAFGINAYVAPNAGDDVVEEHTETLARPRGGVRRAQRPRDVHARRRDARRTGRNRRLRSRRRS